VDEARRPLDRSPYYIHHFEHLDRVLSRPQLAGIGTSGCVGAGIFVNSGALISTTGSLGAAVSYVVAGLIIVCVFYTITEMVACRPITGALIDLPHTFLDPAGGFTVAVLYVLGEICVMTSLTASAAELTALLKHDQKPHTIKAEVSINIAFILLTTLSHCLGMKLYGKIERVVMWFKLCLLLLVIILMVIINLSGTQVSQSEENYTTIGWVSGWNPTGYRTTTPGPLKFTGVAAEDFGINGPGGSLFAFVTSVTLAMLSCFGADIVAMTAGEAKHPWKDVPLSMPFVYLVPLSIYPFVMLAGGANVNYADPNLPKMWARGSGMTKSPFVIAAEGSSLHALPKVLNAFFILSAYTTANTYLYAASRNVFMLLQQYLPRRVAMVFGRTNHGHTPLAAIILCSGLGLLSLIGLADRSGSQPHITLSEIKTSTAACINMCQCITFLKFKAGLDRLEKRKLFSRNDPLYISHLFKSRWQPLPAYIGIGGCAFVIIWSGIPPLVILAAKHSLTSTGSLKSTVDLAFDVFGAYIGPFLFAGLYLGYKYILPRSTSVDVRDLNVEDYVLEDLSTIELEGPSSVPPLRLHPIESHELATQADNEVAGSSSKGEQRYTSVGVVPEDQGEMGVQNATEEERDRVAQILRRRPKRLERGAWREIWSFVVTDKD
ncbi:hypothetical protein CC86DRAFT_431605, partial [Ophiobolus disseminans]